MKRNFFVSIAIVAFLLYGCALWANDILQYNVSQEKVETAWVNDNGDGSYSVVIKLKGQYKEEFVRLTEKNIGKKLQIIFKGQILVQAIIRDKIDSGIITVSHWKSEEEAVKFKDALHTNKKERKEKKDGSN